jgi:putative phage-type endonuclease
MTAVELLPPAEAVHGNERWYELRRAGVTASEIAALMGISPYESPFNLYWSKVNDWRWDGNEYTSAGRHLEDAIADWWMAERDPIENLQAQWAGLYAHPERPWQLATPDRLLYLSCGACGGSGFAGREDVEYGPLACRECDLAGHVGDPVALLECKWVAYSWDGWGEPDTDEVPVYYRAQALWQLDTLGVDEVYFAALGPGGFRSYLVRRDETDLALMRKAAEDFIRRLAEGDPPPLDSHTATLGALKRLYPTVGEGDVQVPHSVAFHYREARRLLKEAEERVALHEAVIREYLEDDHARAVYNGHLVASRSVFDQQRIDSKRLRKERPDIAAEYTTSTTVDRLNPGRTEA